MAQFELFWAPTGQSLGVVLARSLHDAIRKAPQPWHKYPSEIYAVNFWN